jgi:chromosomal replication initiation ATPase DnaA
MFFQNFQQDTSPNSFCHTPLLTIARQGLIDYYGSGGNAMDNAWFGKLTAEVDSNAKKLTLKAPTKFIKDWVQSNYSHLIDKLCSLHNYSLEEMQYV